jgi:hypothetical protein
MRSIAAERTTYSTHSAMASRWLSGIAKASDSSEQTLTDGHHFESPPLHHAVPANRPGFPGDKNPRDSGRLARRAPVCEPNSGCSPVVCAQYHRPVSARKIRFPKLDDGSGWTETAAPRIVSASCRRQRGSAEFGSNLNRLLQPHCAPLLSREHVDQVRFF